MTIIPINGVTKQSITDKVDKKYYKLQVSPVSRKSIYLRIEENGW